MKIKPASPKHQSPSPPFSWDDIAEGKWKFSPKIDKANLIENLRETNWKIVKKRPARKVYLCGDYYVKVYFYKGLIQRLKRIWCDKSVKDWDISNQVFNCCRATPEPVALCVAQDVSIFANRSVEPCLTLGAFIDLKWGVLKRKKRYELTDRFSAFMLAVLRCGLFQTDYNLGNLLIKEGSNRFYIIDMQMARIEERKYFRKKEIANNLAFLLPVFHKIEKRYKLRFLINLAKYYPELKMSVWKIQEKAFQKMRGHWLKKGFRNVKKAASKNYFSNKNGIHGYIDGSTRPNIRNFIMLKPDELFNFSEEILKSSKRAKLSIIKFEGRRYILKRYNLKGWRHRLKRILASSLAWKIWKTNHLIKTRGISTSNLMAVADVGRGLTYRATYALYEYIDDVSEGYQKLRSTFLDDKNRPYMMRHLAEFAWGLHQKGVYHGDLKASNILWPIDVKGRIGVIDLDAVRFQRSLWNWQRISDLKNLASYFLWLDADPAKIDGLFTEYVNLHVPWQGHKFRLYQKFRKKAFRQLKHRIKREASRSSFPQKPK